MKPPYTADAVLACPCGRTRGRRDGVDCSVQSTLSREACSRPPTPLARPHRAQEVTQNATNRTMDVSITMDSSQSMSATMWQNTKDAVATLLDALHAETSAVRRPRSPAPRPPAMTRLMTMS